MCGGANGQVEQPGDEIRTEGCLGNAGTATDCGGCGRQQKRETVGGEFGVVLFRLDTCFVQSAGSQGTGFRLISAAGSCLGPRVYAGIVYGHKQADGSGCTTGNMGAVEGGLVCRDCAEWVQMAGICFPSRTLQRLRRPLPCGGPVRVFVCGVVEESSLEILVSCRAWGWMIHILRRKRMGAHFVAARCISHAWCVGMGAGGRQGYCKLRSAPQQDAHPVPSLRQAHLSHPESHLLCLRISVEAHASM